MRHHLSFISTAVCVAENSRLSPEMAFLTYWAPSQYPKRRLSVRSRKVSKPRDLYLELSDRSEIWQALRQRCCRCACQISKRYHNLKYQSRGFETSRDLTKRRLLGYWDGAQVPERYGSNFKSVIFKLTTKQQLGHSQETHYAIMTSLLRQNDVILT